MSWIFEDRTLKRNGHPRAFLAPSREGPNLPRQQITQGYPHALDADGRRIAAALDLVEKLAALQIGKRHPLTALVEAARVIIGKD